jgi:glutamate 5-kinase
MAGETMATQKRKLVVKIGSSTLVDRNGTVDRAFLNDVVDQLARLVGEGWAPIVVSSGAIACGLERLGIDQRPTDMPSLQAAASVGECALAAAYDEAFGAHGLTSSLVLLTRRDTADRTAYLHARDTLGRLMELGVVPIVNENDTVSVEQIRFGDNDTLAALVSCLIKADLTVILSDVDGFYDKNPSAHPTAKLIERIAFVDHDVMAAAGGSSTTVGSGGMVTKLRAARVLGAAGIPLVVCMGRRDDVIVDVAHGDNVGTIFDPSAHPHEITPYKLWIALGDSARGTLVVDDGAKTALVRKGSSLLVVGVTKVEGGFLEGDIVDIRDTAGDVFARGRVAAPADEVELAVGKNHDELARNRILAHLADKALVHRDELIVFE